LEGGAGVDGSKKRRRNAAVAVILAIVIAIAGVAVYETGLSKTTRTTNSSSTNAAALVVTTIPLAPLISPGETQNYTLVQVVASGAGLSGTVTLRIFTPAGLSLALNQSSVLVSDSPQRITTVLKAGPTISPGNYSVTIESSFADGPGLNQTFTVQVVPMLIIMQDLAFHPSNVTVPAGTKVTWLNLDSQIDCCDPGYHDVSFTALNYTSPVISQYESTSHTFGEDGVYYYYCTIHLFMLGRVTVSG
jgi:plastocyanin